MQERKGIPFTRRGGFIVRFGLRAVAYSVTNAQAFRYKATRFILFLLAVAVAVGVAHGAQFILFTFITPLAVKVGVNFSHYPELCKLVIYGLTLLVGGLIYLQILAAVGKRMVRGVAAFDDGYSLFEQRQRASQTSRWKLILLASVMGVIFLAPIGWEIGLQLFAAGLVGFLFVEGLFFRLIVQAK